MRRPYTVPDGPDLTQLVGELLLKSPAFAGLLPGVQAARDAYRTVTASRPASCPPTRQSREEAGVRFNS